MLGLWPCESIFSYFRFSGYLLVLQKCMCQWSSGMPLIFKKQFYNRSSVYCRFLNFRLHRGGVLVLPLKHKVGCVQLHGQLGCGVNPLGRRLIDCKGLDLPHSLTSLTLTKDCHHLSLGACCLFSRTLNHVLISFLSDIYLPFNLGCTVWSHSEQ